MTSTATSSPISPGRLNPFHSGQNHFYSHAHGHHHLFSPIMNKRRFNSPIRVDELDFLSHNSYNEESDCGVLLDILRSNSGNINNNNHNHNHNHSHSYFSTSPAKGSCMYMTNVNIPHPTNPCPSVVSASATTTTVVTATGGITIPSHGDNNSVTLDSSPLSASTLPLSPIDEEEVEVDFPINNEIQSSPSSHLQQVTSAKYDATLPKKSPTRSLLSSFTPSVEIVVEDTSQMI